MIEIDEQISRPLNLANSAVLRAVEEEEQMKCEIIEPSVKCERKSRARQRFYQRPHTPVHQHQLEQIKTQYLSHQHDITIDRDTVLKINRLATRRNLHKREHSWPPITMATAANNEQQRNVDSNGKQHIRSTSNDNALQFDETVCKRHGIDVIREKFNSPTRIIEPTAQEIRQRRQQQRKLHQQQQQKQEPRSKTRSGESVDVEGVSNNKPKQMINLVKHQELLRKNHKDKSATMTYTSNAHSMKNSVGLEKNMSNIPTVNIPEQQSTEIVCDKKLLAKEDTEDELFKTTTIPIEKGFSHPETKAADEDIGLVEPKRQFYEQLNSYKKWHSYENLNVAANVKPTVKPLQHQSYKRQTHSLERGREARQHKQLPPQKPRFSPRLQRRSMKLATEIKISYDADAQQHNIQVKSLNQPNKAVLDTPNTNIHLNDLEHIPLPATPDKSNTVSVKVEQNGKQQYGFNTDLKSHFLKDQQIYDDSCIYLRSIGLRDNTVAYIPAAITIVPSPTEEIMQHWMESCNLKANIKGVNDFETTTKIPHDLQEKDENLISMEKHATVKSAVTPEGIKHQQRYKQEQQNGKQDVKIAAKIDTDTYVTRLPSTPNGIQLTRQTNVNTKCKTQMNNNNSSNKKPSNLALTTEAATHESIQKTRPPRDINSNADSTECNFIAKEGDETQQEQGIYYTDGEYIYGPYDLHNGFPLENATVRSLEAEQQQQQQLHQQDQIKKYIEAETKSQHKNEIANLTAKYEHIQKSINEHLKQIDSYIENAKAALKSTIATGNKTESSLSSTSTHLQPQSCYNHQQSNLKSQQQEQQQQQQSRETPLKEILRKITKIMEEVKPLQRNQKAKQEIYMQEPTIEAIHQDGEENMPIVDKVLIDLNMLTKHLSEFDKNSSEELKPIMEQLQQTPLVLQFENRPTATTASHVLIKEEITNKENKLEAYESETEKPTQPPPTPPPLPPPPTTPVQIKQEKRKHHHHRDEKLLVTDKLITAQIQSQQHGQQQQKQLKNEMTMSALTPMDKDDDTAAKDKKNNSVLDFITAQHEQEQLVDQVIDTLAKLQNETKENLVNINVSAPDEKIKSNLYQQTPSSSEPATTTNKKEKDVAIMQNCNISALANDSGKDGCNLKSTEGNESQQKLHIKDFADKIADKQFQKYDNLLTKNTNDVVNTNSNNNKPGQRQLIKQENIKHVSSHDDDENKTHKIMKNMEQEQQEEEGGSHDSSGSELSNTYKSSYELPSPYVTMRQISWEDVLASTATQMPTKQSETVLTSSVNIVKPKNDTHIAQSPVTVYEFEPAISGHVPMQSTTTFKPRIQTRKQPHQQSAPTDEPHLPTRTTSPFGLNTIDMPFRQRSPSVSPTRLRTIRIAQDTLAEASRKYLSPLLEPHLPTRATSPFGLNAVEIKSEIRSPSTSPKRNKSNIRTSPRTVDEMAIRKYPAPLAEPHAATRAASPFGLNAVDVFHITRATTPLPPAYGLQMNSEDEPEPDNYDDDEHEDKPTSPIRKYPPALIEPHVPTRAASPFGLNAVKETTKQKSRRRAPSPARGQHHHHPHQAKSLKSSSTNTDTSKKSVAYVPQVEGHNIGLVVHTSTSTPYCSTDATHATCVHSEINATKSPHDYTAITARDITDNKYFATTNDIGRAAAKNDDGDDDAETCDELQRINTNRSSKQEKQPNMRNLNTTGISAAAPATTKTMAHQQYQQHQPQKQELQHDEPEHEHSHLQHQEQYFGGDGSSDDKSGQHMAVNTILLPTSVINRSFDNVSPRPYISIEGYKRVAWPPASEERIVREFTPQPQTQFPPVPGYNQQQNQPTATTNTAAIPPTQQQHRAQSYDNYQPSQHQQQYQQVPQQQQFSPQPQYQGQAPQNQYQQPHVGSLYQQPPQQQQQCQQPAWVQQQQQYQQPPWVQQQQQQQPQPQYQNPLNQYNQAPHHQQQQYPPPQQQQNQFVPQTNQQQFNSYSQPQQQQHTVSHDQVDQQQHQPQLSQDQRGTSPGIITLRKEAPITQKPAPVYTSQPAAVSYRGGSNMRGDLKWPPPEYKEAAAKENEERRKLALGPVCRPRKVQRDYTSFFAKNALSHHYPSYKVPPGTQHMTC